MMRPWRGDCGASALHRLDGAGDSGPARMTQAKWVACFGRAVRHDPVA